MARLQLLDGTLTPHTLQPLAPCPRPYPCVSPSPAEPQVNALSNLIETWLMDEAAIPLFVS